MRILAVGDMVKCLCGCKVVGRIVSCNDDIIVVQRTKGETMNFGSDEKYLIPLTDEERVAAEFIFKVKGKYALL